MERPFENALGMKFVAVPVDGARTAPSARVLFSVWETRVQDYEVFAKEEYRLPSDREWSCAVGIGEREDAAKLPSEKDGKFPDFVPWGSGWPPAAGADNYAGEELQPALATGKYSWVKGVLSGYRDGFVETAPTGSFPASRLGLYDLGGNAWEWCEDWFEKEQTSRVSRGASWSSFACGFVRTSLRSHLTPTTRSSYTGFRCVVAESSSAR